MIFSETKLAGAYVVDIDPQKDNRGHFARVFCEDEFSARGLKFSVVQASVSLNAKRGTVRGLHFQYPPAAEIKYVRCMRGALADVIVDLRPESATYLDHLMIELSAENGRGLYIPERFAHGFITLQDGTEVSYFIGNAYTPAVQGALRYDDPHLKIEWPLPVSVISGRDRKASSVFEIGAELKDRMSVRESMVA
ncbi:dTDP-4-dehydrorhamnose 3,5-epimerase family protein [Pseudorhodoplanes sinuspersici]|uniref:dTDP-4-dehydrorhamnose 3,5-epimerase n=1 Tax=Pseudorhodoplanes sinuspersici TaxID=1235591 RepID=A0A1W6ZQE7_9HYPH|nr:dTDP-4-dehydrorhamnose 3,5-epimerase family protein [Pseudorhodoplanes sinuspersici]ARP99515.1 dTDP-4-dehydrorhamnose 3,5-epimerase [Pseudorhodoplanes sinuspersici]RKE70474.1 dTDP-4-dehydrorhamnose 3,5-epimerase [Pseudorhodoplanes sinuspersici]